MDLEYTPEQIQLRRAVREFAEAEIAPHVMEWVEAQTFPMEVIRKLHPDLTIVDLSLPGANGIELIKNIRAEFPKLPVLVRSMHDESLYA